MKKLKSFDELLTLELLDLYSAEKQLLKAIPRMAKGAESSTLKNALNEHLKQTENQVKRLEKIFETLNISSRGAKCHGMQGLIEEGSELLKMNGHSSVMDAAIIGAAQRVEHYEIAGYGTARTFAHLLGRDNIAEILDESLKEEKDADVKLTEIAENEINLEAVETASETS